MSQGTVADPRAQCRAQIEAVRRVNPRIAAHLDGYLGLLDAPDVTQADVNNMLILCAHAHDTVMRA